MLPKTTMTKNGIVANSGKEQVIDYDTSQNEFGKIYQNKTGNEKGTISAKDALLEIGNFVNAISQVSKPNSTYLERPEFRKIRSEIVKELKKGGVNIDPELYKLLIDTNPKDDDEIENKIYKTIGLPYGSKREKEWKETEPFDDIKPRNFNAPILGPYRSLLAQLSLDKYKGARGKKETGGSRFDRTNPYKGLAVEWISDDLKSAAGNLGDFNKLLDYASEGKLKAPDLELIRELYEAYLIDKRIADAIAKAGAKDWKDYLKSKSYEPSYEDIEDIEIDDIDLDKELQDMMSELEEEGINIRKKHKWRYIMEQRKLRKEEKHRRKLIIEEARQFFAKKKKSLIDFVEESIQGLDYYDKQDVKELLKGKKGSWIRNNIHTVIRAVVEESIKNKRELIKESRKDKRTLVVESKGDYTLRKNKTNRKKSLIEENRKQKLKRKNKLVEEDNIITTNDDYSKAGQYL